METMHQAERMVEDPLTIENGHETGTDVRDNALCLIGVDNLSTAQLKKYLDFYLKDNVAIADQRINGYHLEWVDDSTVVVVFSDAESCSKSIVLLSANYDDTVNLPATDVRSAKEWEFNGPKITQDTDDKDTETSKVELSLRMAFNSDRKVKNAKEFSRYYLLNGEPEYQDRYHNNRQMRGHGGKRRGGYRGSIRKVDSQSKYGKQELFPNKVRAKQELFPEKARSNHNREDLFSNKLSNRDRSPSRDQNRSPEHSQNLANRIGRD